VHIIQLALELVSAPERCLFFTVGQRSHAIQLLSQRLKALGRASLLGKLFFERQAAFLCDVKGQ